MKKYFLFFMVFTLLLTAVMLSACKRENGKVSVLGTPAGSSETAGQSTDKSGRPEKTGSLAADTDSSLNPSATTSVSMHPTSGSTVAATDVSGTSNTPEGGTADRASPSGKTPQMSPTGQNTPTPAPTPTSTPVPEVKAVKFSAEGGIYAAEFKLTISAPSGYIIYYTLDGSDPAVNGKRYTAPLTISQSASRAAGTLTKLVSKNLGYSNPSRQMIGTVVRACAKKGSECLPTLTNSYFVDKGLAAKYSMKYISITLPHYDFGSENGIYVAVMNNPFDKKARAGAYIEIFDENGKRQAGQYAEVSMHGNGSLGNLMKSMRLYFKKDAVAGVSGNPGKLSYDIFEGRVKDSKGTVITEYKRLLLRNSGNDCTWTMIRDSLCHRISSGLNVDIMESEPALVFVDGEFWGMYNIRERYDAKYFEAHYGIDENNFVMLEAPSPLIEGKNNAPYELNDGVAGDEKPFHQLVTYIKTHDLSNESYYKYVCDRLDIDNFIDYWICNLYFVNNDWPNNNIKVWRNKNADDPSGMDTKWRFAMLDMDFCLGGNGGPSSNTLDKFGADIILSNMMAGLLKNESFRMKFAERAIYVARTQFSAERTLPIFEEMKAERASALAFSDTRWIGTGASASSREAQYEIIKNFLTERSQYFIAHISSYFGIEAAETNVYYDSSVKSISIGGKTVASGSVLSSTGEAKITITFTPAAGYTADGILVVNKDGSQSYYKGTSASVALSGRTTVTAIAKKSGFTTTASLTAGSRGIFYLKNNGDLYAWGNSDAGQLGAPTLKLLKVSRIASNVKMVSISNGGNVGDAPMTMILTSDNKIYTVGNNAYGQLGRSGNTGLLLPMENVPQGTVKKISAGHEHSLVLMENGDLYGIGSNASGCIGSTGAGGAVKKLVKIASNVSDMTAGRRHTLYISGGKLYALGDNRWNKLNTSSAQSFSTPVKIADNAKAVFAGEHSSFYIDSSNDLYYFGWRSVTTLNAGTGDGKTHKLLSNVKSVSMQDEHALIFTLDNKVYGWGTNAYGQSMPSSETLQQTPVLLAENCKASAAGSFFSAILKNDGSVVVWGMNANGITGTGASSSKVGQTTLSASMFVK